jgi:endonuclease/exonuclease/phosphatase family metal-dependent hydrolase
LVVAIHVATFNVENLFARFKFGQGIDPDKANKEGWTVDATVFSPLSMDEKAITGAAVRELDADVVCMQEVENTDTLKHFRARSLGGRAAYPYVAGIDGNDPRLIDVAVLARVPIVHVRSYQHLKDPGQESQPLFSRDCLEVGIEWPGPGELLTVFVQHFKSMLGGRKQTSGKRRRQAHAVREIVEDRLGPNPGDQAFIICGDFNDYMETDDQGEPAVGELVEWDQVENVVERRPDDDQWTHYYDDRNEYKQLDYLLLSKSLAEANPGAPEIMRKGMPLRATGYTGERFKGVGLHNPKASDHCPVVMTLN